MYNVYYRIRGVACDSVRVEFICGYSPGTLHFSGQKAMSGRLAQGLPSGRIPVASSVKLMFPFLFHRNRVTFTTITPYGDYEENRRITIQHVNLINSIWVSVYTNPELTSLFRTKTCQNKKDNQTRFLFQAQNPSKRKYFRCRLITNANTSRSANSKRQNNRDTRTNEIRVFKNVYRFDIRSDRRSWRKLKWA